MARNVYVPVISALLLAGCANWNSVYREIDLGREDSSPRGVALDAKQRAILSSPRVTKSANGVTTTTNVICPEASPDALSASSISAALSGALDRPSGTSPTEAQLKAAGAIAEGAASIGLRTQSIQLMRDGLVYNCVLFMNGAITPPEAYSLQRRSQNFTLGLLAIEQLTGPVKAQQAALTAQGGASAGQNDVEKEASALAGQQSKLAAAKSAREQGEIDLKSLKDQEAAQKTKVGDANTAYQAAVKAASGKPADSDEKTQEKNKLEELKAEQATLKGKSEEVQRKQSDVDKQVAEEKSAQQQVKIAEENLQQAQSRVRSYTNATAVLASSGGSGVIITDTIAKAVVDIVKEVLKESGPGETCSAFVLGYYQPRTDSSMSYALLAGIAAVCPRDVQESVKNSKDPVAVQNRQAADTFMRANNIKAPPL